MEHTMFSVPVRTGIRLEAEAATSLYHALQALPDPRRKQGRRYSLAVILSLGDPRQIGRRADDEWRNRMGTPSRPSPGPAVGAAPSEHALPDDLQHMS